MSEQKLRDQLAKLDRRIERLRERRGLLAQQIIELAWAKTK